MKVYKAFRLLSKFVNELLCKIRIVRLKLLYPGISIDFKSKIGKNTKIVCVDGGKMTIKNSVISDGSNIVCDTGAELSIKDSFVGVNCMIIAKEKICIKEYCLIAEMVVIRDHNHNFNSNKSLIKDQGFSSKPIIINENTWVGAKATILMGITINKGSVIGANALINKNTNEYSINVGVPSKEIKIYRN